jgi:DNA-binding CsgD family transcriptional regulator
MSRARRGQPLSSGELATLQWLARGASYKQVGRHRGVTTKAAESTGHRILVKLGALSMAHAVHIAHCRGIICMYPDCGDRAAYLRHIRRGETPGIMCRKAQARNSRERRARSKALS